MATSLLTIIVPTYNRAKRLNLLLTTLCRELHELEATVSVIIADNASTDETPEIIASFTASYSNVIAFRHTSNVGPDENFCSCVERVVTRYFWLIGDDDLPKAGVIGLIVPLLISSIPDLVYIESSPRDEIKDNEPHRPVTDLLPLTMSQMGFARKVQVYSTFISGMIVNRETFVATAEATNLRRFSGTNLVQLGWVLPVLKFGRTFVFVRQRCILSKQGNSGGYSLMTVFGKNFPIVVGEALGSYSRMTRAIVGRCVIGHLPHMIWHLRFGNFGDFKFESAKILRPTLRYYPSYWFFIEPMCHLPLRWAHRVKRLSEMAASAVSRFDRRIESWKGSRSQ